MCQRDSPLCVGKSIRYALVVDLNHPYEPIPLPGDVRALRPLSTVCRRYLAPEIVEFSRRDTLNRVVWFPEANLVRLIWEMGSSANNCQTLCVFNSSCTLLFIMMLWSYRPLLPMCLIAIIWSKLLFCEAPLSSVPCRLVFLHKFSLYHLI